LTDLDIITPQDGTAAVDAQMTRREKSRISFLTLDEREPQLQKLTCIVLASKKDSNVPTLDTRENNDDITSLTTGNTRLSTPVPTVKVAAILGVISFVIF
jgi:hypothetical protein